MGLHLGLKRANVHTYLAERVEYWIEVYKDFAFGDLRNVVETLRGEVAHPVLGIREAYEQRFDELVHVGRDVDAESNGSARESNEPSVPYVQRV